MAVTDSAEQLGDRPPDEPYLAQFLAQHRTQLVDHARWLMRGQPRLPEPEDIVQAACLSFCLYFRRQRHAAVDRGLLTLARQCVETALSDVVKWQAALKRRQEGKAAALPSSGMAPPAGAPGPATAAIDAERAGARRRAVHEAMQDLDPIDRRILELRLEDEDTFTYPCIGELVGMQPDAVRMRYRRAIESLKPVLLAALDGDSEIGRLVGD